MISNAAPINSTDTDINDLSVHIVPSVYDFRSKIGGMGRACIIPDRITDDSRILRIVEVGSKHCIFSIKSMVAPLTFELSGWCRRLEKPAVTVRCSESLEQFYFLK